MRVVTISYLLMVCRCRFYTKKMCNLESDTTSIYGLQRFSTFNMSSELVSYPPRYYRDVSRPLKCFEYVR